MFSGILRTSGSIAPTLLRLVLGVVFFAHGCQKMLGSFGGAGFSVTMRSFENGMHIPTIFAFLAIAAEFFGGLGLIVGFLTRIAAFGIFLQLCAVAIMKVHAKNGFFMNCEWQAARGGIRVPPARAGHDCRPHDRRGRGVLRRRGDYPTQHVSSSLNPVEKREETGIRCRLTYVICIEGQWAH